MKAKNIFCLSACFIFCFAVMLPVYATTYVFGEDGTNQDLTGQAPAGIWTSDDEFIIAGDCYVPDDATLKINAGVTVKFDYDYGGDYTGYPTIDVRGTLDLNGVSGSEVTFTNYSGTTAGEFEGIRLNGSITGYEGRMTADYAVFRFGGRTNGLISIDSGGELIISNCTIRDSQTDGIASIAAFDSLRIVDCEIKSNGAKAIDVTHSAPYVDLVNVICSDGGNRVRLPNGGFERFINIDGMFVDGTNGNDPGLEISAPGNLTQGYVLRSHFYDCGGDGILLDYQGDDMMLTIRNCASAGNGGSGIEIGDYDPFVQFGATRFLNCVLWDNDESGIRVSPMDEWDAEFEGHEIILIQNCIMGMNDDFGLEITDEHGNFVFDFGDNINAYKDNGIDSYNAEVEPPFDPIEDINDAPDHFELYNEAHSALTPPYDFHIKWDSPEPADRSLINEGDEDEGCGLDVDGSQTDIGLFGGQEVSNFERPDFFSNSRNLDFYVRVGYTQETHEVELRRNVYRIFGKWQTGWGGGDDFEIEAGTRLEFTGAYEFAVHNTLIVNGTAENHVVMTIAEEGDEWNGIFAYTHATVDCEFNYLDIDNVLNSNYTGLTLYWLDEGEAGWRQVPINYVKITESNFGLKIYNTPAILRGCEASGNEDRGLNIYGNNDDVEVLGGIFSSNGGDGVYVYGSGNATIFDANDDYDEEDSEYYTHIEGNDGYGLHSRSSAVPNLADPIDGSLVEIANNAQPQIYVSNYNSRPTLQDGLNDIYSNGFEALAIDYDNFIDGWNQTRTLDAEQNFWGTDTPDEDEADLFDGPVDYNPWSEARNTIDDFRAFGLALHYLRSEDPDTIAMAAPLFLEVAESRDFSEHSRFASLSYVRNAVRCGGGRLGELRARLLDYAGNVRDPGLARVARSQAIWCLSDLGNGEAAIAEAVGYQQDEDVNVQDSLLYAIDELCLRQLHEGRDDEPDAVTGFEERLEELSRLIGEVGDRRRSRALPDSFELSLNAYPNPFNGMTRISFQLAEASPVKIVIADLAGRKVATVAEGEFVFGSHDLAWNAKGVPSGEYFIKLQAGNLSASKSIRLVK